MESEHTCQCQQIKTVEKYLHSKGHTVSLAHTTSWPASGSVISAIVYYRFSIDANGFEFSGNAGGIGLPGAAALEGTLYMTNDTLFTDTVSFSFVSVPAYCAVMFYNGNSELLGHLQSANIGIITGTGGGTGSWRSTSSTSSTSSK
jgi:hypothetical protein